ncbi:MAG: BTAD domain-containing putative transcriptional regulator [Chloroflexota bacterium]
MLSIRTLGEVSFAVDGEPIKSLRSRSATALLIYLACHRRSFSRDYLAEFFWEGRTASQSSANLRTALKLLRPSFANYLLIERQSIRFNHESAFEIDAARFAEQLETLLPSLEPSLLESQLKQLADALDLYRGDFLESFYLSSAPDFEAWQREERTRFQLLAERGLQELITYYLATGDYRKGIKEARRLLTFEPFDESVHRQLMWLLLRNGQRNAALQQYEKCRRTLAEKLDVEPDAATTAVYQQIRTLSFPPAVQLPTTPTRFFGRQTERKTLVNLLLSPHHSLVTIFAAGGMGKTRLAVEVARTIATQQPGRFLNGIFFIPLAPLATSDLIPTTIADVLNLSLSGPGSRAKQLAEQLRTRECLLILDNFEHLLDAPGLNILASILTQAPRVSLLVTSRIRLGLMEEHLFELSGLPYPTKRSDMQAALSYEAVTLFVEQARRLRHGFAPDGEEMADVVKLCQFVGGMPLGIELAASGVRLYSCRQLLNQLQIQPDLEFGLAVNRPDRHRNLRTLFEHSWSLLTESEQIIASRFAVFHGPFDLPAAQSITGATPLQVGLLLDKSFLQRHDDERFSLHPLLHQFLAEKFEARPTLGAETKYKHAVHYHDMLRASKTGNHNMEKDYFSILRVIKSNLDNVVAAALWLADQPDPDQQILTRDSGYLSHFTQMTMFNFKRSGQFELGKTTFSQILQKLVNNPSAKEPHAHAVVFFVRNHLSQLNYLLHDYDQAASEINGLLSDPDLQPDNIYRSVAYNMMALILGRRGQFEGAFAMFEASLDIARADLPHFIWPILQDYGEVLLSAGKFDAAEQAWEKMLQLALGVDSGDALRCIYEVGLGRIASQRGEREKARDLLESGLILSRKAEYQQQIILALLALARLASNQGDTEEARNLLDETIKLARQPQDARFLALCELEYGWLAEVEGKFSTAARHYELAIAGLKQIQDLGSLPVAQRHLERLRVVAH